MNDPAKMWKYNEKDFEEAKRWDEYRKAYNTASNIATKYHGRLSPLIRTGIKNLLLLQRCLIY